MRKLARRKFVQLAATAGAGLAAVRKLDAIGLSALSSLSNERTLEIPDTGWKLWPDTQAAWKDDDLYLPDEVNLSELPVNPPTGGWPVLETQGIDVTLPSTVEQHFWGNFGLRPYKTSEYTYAASDPEVKNGNYEGVSWWYRSIQIPAAFANKIVLLHLRGVRQRAEIYINHKLTGYDLIAETAFDADISRAILPGEENRIAIRITNPGGRLDWRDSVKLQWGNYWMTSSPGFGGLDRGISITAHDPIYLSDAWVLNTAVSREILAYVTVRNTTNRTQVGTLRFSIIDPATQAIRATARVTARLGASETANLSAPLRDGTAKLWDFDSPNLYGLRAEWSSASAADERTVRFGFRSFEPRGVGKDAGLYLNGRRIRIYTAISWGFWGLNGLWPTQELARKEVETAKSLGLNALNFHRNIGKEEVLARQDELGLLRYLEPGGGSFAFPGGAPIDAPAPRNFDTSGKGGQPESFLERYTTEKILRMVKMFRSHPSVMMYVIKNEFNPDIASPQLWYALRAMQALDPSRVIVTKSGISYRHEAWLAPYDDSAHYDDGTGYCGWRDQHTVGGPGVWTDDLYQDPEHFTHQLDDPKEIVDWGEMLGAASADHHDLMVHQIETAGGTSYDLLDHREIDAAYNAYLDQSGLRSSFLTTGQVYHQIGNKAFEFWGRVIESARLSDSNDILTISGWESTAIENHSGLVDNLRNPKADPRLLAPHLAPLLPVVRPRGVVHAAGDPILADLYLLNETGKTASGELQLTLTSPSGTQTVLGSWTVPSYVQNQFVYPVMMGLAIPTLRSAGTYKLTVRLIGSTAVENSETIQIFEPLPAQMPSMRVGIIGNSDALFGQLAVLPSVQSEVWNHSKSYDLMISIERPKGQIVRFDDGSHIANTEDEPLYRASIRGKSNSFTLHFGGLPPGTATVSLYFADSADARPGQRLFDIQLNHQTVATGFDIAAEAGGGNAAVVKTFTTKTVNGGIDLGPGKVTGTGSHFSDALFNAVKITVTGKTFAYALGGERYTDKSGLVWEAYIPQSDLSPEILDLVQAGTPLLVMAADETSAASAAMVLANAGAFQLMGSIPTARAPWMGNWILVGKHPLFDGLPQQEVMHGDYQFDVLRCYGLQVEGTGVEVLAAYGRDHDRNLGAAIFTARFGRGTVLFHGLPEGAAPVVQTRLLANAIVFLGQRRSS